MHVVQSMQSGRFLAELSKSPRKCIRCGKKLRAHSIRSVRRQTNSWPLIVSTHSDHIRSGSSNFSFLSCDLGPGQKLHSTHSELRSIENDAFGWLEILFTLVNFPTSAEIAAIARVRALRELQLRGKAMGKTKKKEGKGRLDKYGASSRNILLAFHHKR